MEGLLSIKGNNIPENFYPKIHSHDLPTPKRELNISNMKKINGTSIAHDNHRVSSHHPRDIHFYLGLKPSKYDKFLEATCKGKVANEYVELLSSPIFFPHALACVT